MSTNASKQHPRSPRWAYLLLAVLLLLLACALVSGLWMMPRLLSWFVPHPTAAPVEVVRPAIVTPTAIRTIVSPTPTRLDPPASVTAAPTAVVNHAVVGETWARADGLAGTIVFGLMAEVPPDRQIADLFLWYDTEAGRQGHHFEGPLPPNASLSYQLDAGHEGLTTAANTGQIDYWWLVRDTAGETARAGGTVGLEPALQALVATPTPNPPPIDFTWAVSESRHYGFHYVPGSAAERDVHRIGVMAEAALARTSEALEVEFDGKMNIYLVPRIFWQGAATYGNKVQLISYLDRNYTAVETWSYFTHEGAHALAQDLARAVGRPEGKGGPDGVLVEGLAVWASGGHYRREPLDAWAAVAAASKAYIPLAELRAGPFYEFQHELSYLEAASFVKFLVEHYGLDRIKELYGLATGEAAHDEALVQRLYGQGYDRLEAAWLDHLAGLEPTPEEAETWHLTHRSFDLMRRYESEMDPDARILPSSAPPEWTSDTLKIFTHRLGAPANVVLETALIVAQERLYSGDLSGAAGLLDDVEAALDAQGGGQHAHGSVGELDQPSLKARRAILDQVAAQDRAVLRADAEAYLATVSPASALALEPDMETRLHPPFTAYQQEVVRLDVSDDGQRAQGVVLVHAELAARICALRSMPTCSTYNEDGQLFAVTFRRNGGRWLMTSRELTEPILAPLPSVDRSSPPN